MIALDEYLRLRTAPDGQPVMKQRWEDLLFMHFPVDPGLVQATLPEGLTADTFPDTSGIEKAWIGLVPFHMKNVRPARLPAIRGLSDFPETNVRTYVHQNGKTPGVWFYSLDAANAIAVQFARLRFKLPYFRALMATERLGDIANYQSKRVGNGATLRTEAEISPQVTEALPGSLEFFLLERYALFAGPANDLLFGQVHHSPYRYSKAKVLLLEDELCAAAGFPIQKIQHSVFVESVDVDIYSPCKA